MATDGPDAIFNVSNNYFIGAYQAAINEASELKGLSDQEATERDAYVYRSYLALGSAALVVAEIGDSAPTALQAVKLLAVYKTQPFEKESVLTTLRELLDDPACGSNSTLQLMAATIYAADGNMNEALKCCHGGATLELQAMYVQLLLNINRIDLAEKQLRSMQAVDDDATMTQLATAWVNLALGGKKVQEAFYCFQEQGDKYTWTPKLHNGNAVCHMHMGQYEDAEKELLEALSKESKDQETLANLAIVSMHLNKPATRYLTQLGIENSSHPMITGIAQFNADFKTAAASVTA